MLKKESKIYVAGHRGLVGSAIWNNLLQRGYENLVGRSHKELDLTSEAAVENFFAEERPRCSGIGCCFRWWNHGELALSCRLHHAEYEDAV